MDERSSKPLVERRSISSLSLAWLIVALQSAGFDHVALLLALATAIILTYAFLRKPRELVSRWLGRGFQEDIMSENNPVLKFGEASDELQKKIRVGNTVMAQADFVAAATAFEQISSLAEKENGASHPLCFDAIRCRAMILSWRGYNWQAKELFTEAYHLANKEFRENDQTRIFFIVPLARAAQDCFEMGEAVTLHEEIVRIIRFVKKRGTRCPHVLGFAELTLVATYTLSGQYEKALRVLDSISEPLGEVETFNFEALRASLKARLGNREEACEILDEVQLKFHHRTTATPNPTVTMMVVPTVILANLELGRCGPEALDVSQLEAVLDRSMEDSLQTTTFRGTFASSSISTKLLLVIFRIHQKKLTDSKRELGQMISLMSKAEQPFLWTCHALRGAILCWEKKHMEAEEHVTTAMRGHLVYFGRNTAEFHHLNLLYGHILLARGHAARAKGCLAEVRDFVAQNPSDQLYCIITEEQFGLACICNGEHEEGKAVLELLLAKSKFRREARFASARGLVFRSLGSLAAVAGEYEKAMELLGEDPSNEIQSSVSTAVDKNAEIGPLLTAWNIAWIRYELQDRIGAIEQIQSAHERCLNVFGKDHKMTLSCRHDQALLRADENMLEQLQELQNDICDVLGDSHVLTEKIRKSISLHQSLAGSVAAIDILTCHEREYSIGSPVNLRPQLAEVDWLTWSWNDGSFRKITRADSLLVDDTPAFQSVSEQSEGGSSSEWWERIPPNRAGQNVHESSPTPARREAASYLKPATDVYAKLVLDFVRDFSPAFTESHYTSSRAVPLETVAPLGSGAYSLGQVEKVRDPVSDQVYARKCLADTKSVEQNATIRAEVNSMRRLSHAHIVKLCAAYVIPKEGIYALLIQPVADCNLSVYLGKTTGEQADEQRCRNLLSWLPCMTDALQYMHRKKIRHQDIKPDNILVHGTNVCFTDFGIARDWATRHGSRTMGQGQGTVPYKAPEVVNHHVIGSKADLFSLGCVFVEILNVAELHKSMADLRGFMLSDLEADSYQEGTTYEEFHTWFNSSEIYQTAVSGMLHEDPMQRSTTELVLDRLSTCQYGDIGALRCNHMPKQTDRA